MGLDMYLSAKKNLHPSTPEEIETINALNEQLGLPPLPTDISDAWDAFRVNTVKISVMTWRKANAIHRWFIDEYSDEGEDDCAPIYVPRMGIQELKDLCDKVLADNSRAEELLPTKSGFFFGSTDYDEWYFADIKRTAAELEAILNNEAFKDLNFEYQASW